MNADGRRNGRGFPKEKSAAVTASGVTVAHVECDCFGETDL